MTYPHDTQGDRLATALQSLATRPHPPAPVDELIRRGRRAKRNRRAAMAGGSTVLAAAVATPLLFTGGGDPAVVRPGRLDADAALVSAAEATTRSTFRVRVTKTFRMKGRRDDVRAWQGAFDPGRRRGYLRGPLDEPASRQHETRYIGADVYIGGGKQWFKDRTGDRLHSEDNRGMIGPSQVSADPAGMLRRLKKIGKLTRIDHRGQTSTYAFVFKPIDPPQRDNSDRVTALITVSGGKVRRFQQSVFIPPLPDKLADPNGLTIISDIAFSDYGVPVSVAVPPNAKPRG